MPLEEKLMTENELYHFGVKGMRWGHRKSVHKAEKKLNKLAKKSTRAKNNYESYENSYKLADAGARKSLSPTQYGRWYVSDARTQQRTRIKHLKKVSEKTKRKTEKYMDTLSENYVVVYDVTTEQYTLRSK